MSQEKQLKELSPAATSIGWVGTGVMGRPMCRHIMDQGYSMCVHNRTREKAQPLLENGAAWADSPKAVAAGADIVFTIVGFPEDVWAVYLGKNGILEGVRPGSILVDMTTTEPALAQEIYRDAGPRGAHVVDAPVSGGDVGARNAVLSIMAGGDRDVVDHIMPLFRMMGENIVYQGEAGAGQHTKMCNQIAIAGTMIGVCESLLYGYKAGLDLETMLSSIKSGAARCWTLEALAPRILQGDFHPGFFVEHFIKDMEIALKEAVRMSLPLPGLALVHQLYVALKAQGHGKSGTQALYLALESLAGGSR